MTRLLDYGTVSNSPGRMARLVACFAAVIVPLVLLQRTLPIAAGIAKRGIASLHRRVAYNGCVGYVGESDTAVYDQAVDRAPGSQSVRPAERLAESLAQSDAESGGLVHCVSGLRQLPPREILPVFLHARSAPGEAERLVYVTFDATAFTTGGARPLYVNIFSPAGAMRSWQRAQQQARMPILENVTQPLRLSFGQPDPADSSHFLIAYELGSRRGVIDGWLRAGDHISFSARQLGRVTKAGDNG